MTRASGELGLIGFLEGNPGRAARLLGGALLSTMANGDTGGQVRFLELLGRGFEEVNRHAEALKFFERAIKLAEADPDCGLPFMGYEGKAQALVSLGRTDEAKVVLENALTKARSQEKRGHEAQLLILLGKLAAQKGDRQQAVKYLEDAGQFATQAAVLPDGSRRHVRTGDKSIVMPEILPQRMRVRLRVWPRASGLVIVIMCLAT